MFTDTREKADGTVAASSMDHSCGTCQESELSGVIAFVIESNVERPMTLLPFSFVPQ